MTKPDVFNSPRSLVTRAREQIVQANNDAKAFFASKPYRRVVERRGADNLYKVKLVEGMPGKVSLEVRDAVGNLRSALDQVVYASAKAIKGTEPKKTHFPFGRLRTEVEANFDQGAGNPSELRQLILSFEPHEAGNQRLWALNALRNIGTHRVVVPVASQATLGEMSTGSFTMSGPARVGYSKWDPVHLELEYASLPAADQFPHDIKWASYLAFDASLKGLAGKPAINELVSIADEIDSIINRIEVETLLVTSKTP